ncbi:MAG: SMC-Scp complex subunit ScpB [Clostridia bacterium]|nr:SMC-Scp complex subunit ScpB [Clostridia bacterium]
MLENYLEALIFAAADGIKYNTIIENLKDYSKKEIDIALENLRKKYSNKSGIILICYNKIYQFQTNPEYSDLLVNILQPIKERKLSKTIYQTLALIAYKQPITRLEIEEARGVNSDYAINMLLKASLIEIVDRKNTVGRPALFGTTDSFLRKFQLESLEDLPSHDEIRKLIEESGKFNAKSGNLYEIRNKELYDTSELNEEEQSSQTNEISEDIEKPEFLEGQDVLILESRESKDNLQDKEDNIELSDEEISNFVVEDFDKLESKDNSSSTDDDDNN